jgi:hypothetical protein
MVLRLRAPAHATRHATACTLPPHGGGAGVHLLSSSGRYAWLDHADPGQAHSDRQRRRVYGRRQCSAAPRAVRRRGKRALSIRVSFPDRLVCRFALLASNARTRPARQSTVTPVRWVSPRVHPPARPPHRRRARRRRGGVDAPPSVPGSACKRNCSRASVSNPASRLRPFLLPRLRPFLLPHPSLFQLVT